MQGTPLVCHEIVMFYVMGLVHKNFRDVCVE